MFEFLIRDCDENGFPDVSECSNCQKIIPSAQLNLHNRKCAKKSKEKKYA